MKIFYKKIISMVLILSVLSGVLIMPASATPGAAVDYVSGQLWDLMQLQDIDTGLSFWKNLVKKYLAPGVTESTATAADWAAAYGGGSSGGGGAGKDSFVGNIKNPIVGNTDSFLMFPSTSPNIFYCGTLADVYDIPTDDVFEKKYILDTYTFHARRFDHIDSGKFMDLAFYFKVPVTGFYFLSWPSNVGPRTSSSQNIIYYKTPKVNALCGTAIHPFYPDISTSALSSNSILLDASIIYSIQVSIPLKSAPNIWVDYSAQMMFSPDTAYFNGLIMDGGVTTSGSRPGAFGGGSSSGGGAGRDLPYIGKKDDTGKLTAVSGAVFDEKAGTYMNPFDGVLKNVKSWTYDYTTRAYTLTLADDTTVVLTYGDDNVTIVEGGKTYTFYYLIPAAVTPSPSPSVPPVSPSPSVPPVSPSPGCNHVYTDKILQKPTCTVAGSMERSCSLCGGSIIERIPASGHDWLLTNSVADVLGADGKVVTEGYDLYKCSVCHLEYKDFARTGPPGKDVGNSISKLITDLFDSLGVLIGKGIDWLLSLGTKAMAGFTQVTDFFVKQAALVGGFGGGFLLFLSSAFALIPPELLACITFALICAVLGMVAKLVFLK